MSAHETSPPPLRVGLGYRRALHDGLLALEPGVIDFVEVAPENYAGVGGRWRRRLSEIRARWPVMTHGLALSLGGEEPLDDALVSAVAGFVEEVGTPWHSDHLCWSMSEGSHLHELLPIAFTRASMKRVVERIRWMQSQLSVPFAIENVSAYLRRPEDEYDEADFISEVVERSGCRLLLDVNNVYVNAKNFGFDPSAMLARLPLEAAVQIHVAGFWTEPDGLLIDTHGEAIADPVWPLLEAALARTGPVPVLLERDHNIPDLEALLAEVGKIRSIGARVFGVGSRPFPSGDPRGKPAGREVAREPHGPAAPSARGLDAPKLARAILDREPTDVALPPRAAVYRRIVRANLRTVIRNAFPQTLSLLGEEAFTALVDDFLASGGPSTPLYRDIPGELAAWAGEEAYPLADLLAFEWLELIAARHPADIDALPPVESGLVRPNPTMQLAVFDRPVERLQPGEPEPARFEAPRAYAVWRRPGTDAVEFHQLGLAIARAIARAGLEPSPAEVLAQRIVEETPGLDPKTLLAALTSAVEALRARGGVLS